MEEKDVQVFVGVRHAEPAGVMISILRKGGTVYPPLQDAVFLIGTRAQEDASDNLSPATAIALDLF
jgi:hypothetical protein